MGENGGTQISINTNKMISVEEALEIVLNVAQRLPPVILPIHEVLGKILAEDITAPDPLPPYPASIKVLFFHTYVLFYQLGIAPYWKICCIC